VNDPGLTLDSSPRALFRVVHATVPSVRYPAMNAAENLAHVSCTGLAYAAPAIGPIITSGFRDEHDE
jgi:hypothetical protein